MSDTLPENVTLDWLGRYVVESRAEMRAFREEMGAFRDSTEGSFRAVARELQSLRDDVNVSAAILRRIDHSLEGYGSEHRALYELIADLRRRVETLEAAR